MAWVMIRRTLPLVSLTAIALSACSTAGGDGRYPSLAIRDVERAQGQFEPVEPAKLDVPPVDTGLTGPLNVRLAALVDQAQQAHAGFMSSLPRTRQLVAAAAGSSPGSDSWAAAQIALSDLDSARSHAAIALGDLDILHIAATTEAQDQAAIDAARNQVITLVAEEDGVLASLRGRIR